MPYSQTKGPVWGHSCKASVSHVVLNTVGNYKMSKEPLCQKTSAIHLPSLIWDYMPHVQGSPEVYRGLHQLWSTSLYYIYYLEDRAEEGRKKEACMCHVGPGY